jgi:glucose/arabinose dehydrogenase
LFIVQQGGLIRIFDLFARSFRGASFLDVSGLLSAGGERGLLGLAFDPGYAANRQFYIFYTDANGDVVVARFLRDSTNQDIADPTSRVPLLTVPHPGFSNHNGGMLAFGPDQCLYVGIGDGGGSGDPGNNGQNTNQRLGKILRIDPNTGAACTNNGVSNPFAGGGGAPEIWSLGLRNPWRFSFDRQTGDLYIGDVGQNCREEIDVSLAPNAGQGINYGWRLAEGFALFDPSGCPGSTTPPNTPPVLDYLHDNGACSVTGGYVYRGTTQPSLAGTYFYGDFCSGFVRSFRFLSGQVTQQTEWPLLAPGGNITSFGEDAQGELYLMTLQGNLFQVVPN